MPGNGVGEIALLCNEPRFFIVKALTNCYLWGIDGSKFRHIVHSLGLQ